MSKVLSSRLLKSSPKLSLFIWAYVALKLFFYKPLVKVDSSWQELFIFTACCLFIWQLLILYAHFKSQGTLEQQLSLNWIEPNDAVGLFLILWTGHDPLVYQYLWGFWVFTGVVVTLLVVLLYKSAIELYINKSATNWLIGCLVFSCLILFWEKNAYVHHFGVPIVGHFLEKPEFNTTYRISLTPETSFRSYEAIADVQVTRHKHGYRYRDIWIRRVYFPNGGSFTPYISEPLDLGETVSITDQSGRMWSVKLLAPEIQ
jgi:hypothetical protein